MHPGKFLLPELGEGLGRYAEQKLSQRKVEIIKGPRVAGYDGSVVKLTDGTSIHATTLIWTAGIKPGVAIESLGCKKERGRLLVNEQMITLHNVQALSDRLARIRAQTKRRSEEQTSLATNVRSS